MSGFGYMTFANFLALSEAFIQTPYDDFVLPRNKPNAFLEPTFCAKPTYVRRGTITIGERQSLNGDSATRIYCVNVKFMPPSRQIGCMRMLSAFGTMAALSLNLVLISAVKISKSQCNSTYLSGCILRRWLLCCCITPTDNRNGLH